MTTESRKWFALAIICVAQFMVILDVSIVNVALPSIQRGLHFSEQNLLWVLNAYALFFGGFLMLGGRVADKLGRRRVFVTGVMLFSVASLFCGLASSSGWLVTAARYRASERQSSHPQRCPSSPSLSRRGQSATRR